MTTPRRVPVQARSRARVVALLDAAVAEFAEEGFLGATTERIARRAGVPIGSLYQWFPDKAALLYGIADRHLQEAEAQVAAALARAEAAPDLELALGEVVRAAVAANDGDPRIHRILYLEAARPPALQERLDRLEATLAGWIAGQLGRFGVDPAGGVELRSRMLVAALGAIVHEVVIDDRHGWSRRSATDDAVRVAVALARA